MKGLKAILLEALIDFLEHFSELKVINSRIELESCEIINIKGIHTLKWFFFMNKWRENKFQIDLNCLIEIVDINISELVLPYFYIVYLLG